MGILLFILVVVPLFFQISFGSGIIPIHKKMKFWHICVISVVLWFVTSFINVKSLTHIMDIKGIKCGQPLAGLLMMEIVVAIAIALTIFIQILVKFFRKRRKSY